MWLPLSAGTGGGAPRSGVEPSGPGMGGVAFGCAPRSGDEPRLVLNLARKSEVRPAQRG